MEASGEFEEGGAGGISLVVASVDISGGPKFGKLLHPKRADDMVSGACVGVSGIGGPVSDDEGGWGIPVCVLVLLRGTDCSLK